MSSKRKVLKNSLLYMFSSLLVKAMGFLLLPIYTLFLNPDDFGVTNLVTGFINVTTFIVAFSLYSAAIRFYTDYKENQERLKRFYSTLVIFIIISGLTSLCLGILLKDIMVRILFDGIEFYPIVLIALLSLIFISLYTLHQSILQGMQQGKKLTIINLAVFVSTAILTIILIGVFDLGVVGFLLAQLVVYISYSIYIIYDLKRNNLLEWSIDISLLKESLKYSIPLMPHNLSTNIASFVSRIFINTNGTLTAVGLYSIGMQFGNLIDNVQIAVNRAFQPWFFEMMKKHDAKSIREAVELSNVLLIFYSLIYMGIGLFSQEIIILVTNDNYILAWTIIPIFVVGFSIKSIYYFYVNIIMFYKEAARKLFIATIIGSFGDIIFAYFLVPYYGMYGSAISFLLSKLIIVSIVIFLSNQYDDVGYSFLKMLSIILPSLLFMAVGLYFSYTRYLSVFSSINLIYKVIVLAIYIGFVYLTNKRIIERSFKSGQVQKIFKRGK